MKFLRAIPISKIPPRTGGGRRKSTSVLYNQIAKSSRPIVLCPYNVNQLMKDYACNMPCACAGTRM